MADLSLDRPLPVAPSGYRSSGWWGLALTIATEAALFAFLIFAYAYLGSQSATPWPPGGAPSLRLALPNTVVLLASSVAAWWGQKGIERGRRGQLVIGLALALVLGIAFTAVQGFEWADKPHGPSNSSYLSLYFTITGVHLAHVAVGLAMLLTLLVWAIAGCFTERRHEHVGVGLLYWHFVDAVWLAVFTIFYLIPRLGVF